MGFEPTTSSFVNEHSFDQPVWPNVSLRTKKMWVRILCCHLNFTPVPSEEFLYIQATIECRFTLKRVRDMVITYSYKSVIYYDHNS